MGHHDHDGLMYALAEQREELEALQERIGAKDPGGDEESSNAHGLFGALIVEPEGAWFSDPVRGLDHEADGLYADVHLRPRDVLLEAEKSAFPDPALGGERPPRYPAADASFREYVLFIHDEPAAAAAPTPACPAIQNPAPSGGREPRH